MVESARESELKKELVNALRLMKGAETTIRRALEVVQSQEDSGQQIVRGKSDVE